MSTLTIAVYATLAFGILAITVNMLLLKKRADKLQKQLAKFSESGTENNLTFTSQEILDNRIIGLDGIKRIIQVMERNQKTHQCILIHLDDVISCHVKSIYKRSAVKWSATRFTEEFLEKLIIEFLMKNDKPLIQLPFYVYREDHIIKTRELSKKATHWETMLSKMLTKNFKKIA